MNREIGFENRILHGIHDRSKNKVMLIISKNPMVTDPNESPFLVSRDHQFTTETSEIIQLVKSTKSAELLGKIKRGLANIAILPGLLVSTIYVLKLFGIFSQAAILEDLVSETLTNQLFWIAILGVIVLWHDYYKKIVSPKKLPIVTTIPDNEIEDIKANGFKFGRYAIHNTLRYITEDTLALISGYTQKKQINIFSIFTELLEDKEINEFLKRANLEIDLSELQEATSKVDEFKYPMHSISSLMNYALEEALLTESRYLDPVHIFLAIIKLSKSITKYVESHGSSLSVLREATRFTQGLKYRVDKVNIFNSEMPYYKTGGIARNWIYGYTYILNHFSKDVNEYVSKENSTYGIGHESEVEALVSVLGKISKKHALLIGEPGVGKSSLVKGLAQRINWGDVPPQLEHKRIVQFDVNGLIAYSAKGNVEENIQKAMNELAKAGNTILYIDEMQELIPTKAEESGHSMASILLPYVLESKFPIIGTVNYADYKKYFYTNESFRQSFSSIEVSELTISETLKILESKVEQLEENFGIFLTTSALISSAELAQRYITNRMLPDSAVDVLESACSWAQSNGIEKVTEEHIAKSVSIKTNINIETVDNDEADRLIKIDEKIKEKVVGQDDAVNTVVDALRRSRTGVNSPNKPIGVFLFIGPTGVGKTYLAKVVAEEFFGNEKDMIRVDMSEYQDEGSSKRFLGSQKSNAHSQTEITLLDRVKTNPYTVVLFDEIEKAHPDILNLFLQLFDEGRLTSSLGETVDFTNTIIINTSNIGSEILMKSLDEKALWDETKAKVVIELKQSIKPELFNRFDGIVVFSPHSVDNLAKITDLLLRELSKRLSQQKISIEWGDTIPMLIANKAYEPAFGARPIKRYIQEKVEGKIAEEILEKKTNAGDSIKIQESWIV